MQSVITWLAHRTLYLCRCLDLEDEAVPYFHVIPVDGSSDDTDEGQCGEIKYHSVPTSCVANPALLSGIPNPAPSLDGQPARGSQLLRPLWLRRRGDRGLAWIERAPSSGDGNYLVKIHLEGRLSFASFMDVGNNVFL